MRVHASIPIGEIAATLPHVTKLLDVLGVDYVMHGNLSLRDACAEAGVDPSAVRSAIEAIPREEADRPAWADASTQEILDELRARRHPKLLTMMADTGTLLVESPAGTEGLGALRERFRDLCDVLQPHMKEEEHMLFPMIQHLEDCWTRGAEPAIDFVGGIEKPMRGLIEDHASIIGKLRALAAAANEVHGHDGLLDRLLDQVAELQHEIREHIHLENNVLYPRVVALEAAIGR